MFRTCLAALMFAVACATPAAAADSAATASTPSTIAEPAPIGEVDWSLPAIHFGAPERSRGAVLPALYVGLASLNAFDAYSTTAALSRGAREANALMRGAAGHAPAMWAVKGGVTAATIYTAERLWRDNRKGQAILLMVASNAVMAAVATVNANVLRQQATVGASSR